MRNWLVALILILGLAACAGAEDWNWQAGVGIGPIKLGLPMLAPTALLTPDRKLEGNMGGIYLTYKEQIETQCQDGKIVQIVVLRSNFNSRKGPVAIKFPRNLQIGSPSGLMEQALGRNYQSKNIPTAKGHPVRTYYAYTSLGLGVLTEGGNVLQFDIFPRR